VEDSFKVILICLAFFFFYFAIGVFNFSNFGVVNNSVDFFIHWGKVNDLSFHLEYPSFYHFVFQVFNSSQLLFYGINLLVICVLIPVLLFVLTKTYWSSVLYFCGVSIPHLFIYASTFPQALVFVLILIYLINRKNWLVFGVTGLLACCLHRHGVYLFGLILVAEGVEFVFNRLKNRFAPYVALGVQKFDSLFVTLFYLVTQISLVVFLFGRNIVFNIFYLVFCFVPICFLNYDARIISVTSLGLIIVASPMIAKSKHKWLIGLILFFYLLFFLLEFVVGTTKMLLA